MQRIINRSGLIHVGIARVLDAHYNGDQPGDSDESELDDHDKLGQDDSMRFFLTVSSVGKPRHTETL